MLGEVQLAPPLSFIPFSALRSEEEELLHVSKDTCFLEFLLKSRVYTWSRPLKHINLHVEITTASSQEGTVPWTCLPLIFWWWTVKYTGHQKLKMILYCIGDYYLAAQQSDVENVVKPLNPASDINHIIWMELRGGQGMIKLHVMPICSSILNCPSIRGEKITLQPHDDHHYCMLALPSMCHVFSHNPPDISFWLREWAGRRDRLQGYLNHNALLWGTATYKWDIGVRVGHFLPLTWVSTKPPYRKRFLCEGVPRLRSWVGGCSRGFTH